VIVKTANGGGEAISHRGKRNGSFKPIWGLKKNGKWKHQRVAKRLGERKIPEKRSRRRAQSPGRPNSAQLDKKRPEDVGAGREKKKKKKKKKKNFAGKKQVAVRKRYAAPRKESPIASGGKKKNRCPKLKSRSHSQDALTNRGGER